MIYGQNLAGFSHNNFQIQLISALMESFLTRSIENQVIKRLVPNKVVVLLGPRRVGKTVLIRQIIERLEAPCLLLNGEDMDARRRLEHRRKQHYLNLLGSKRILIIEEAQKIPEVGSILKLMVDEIKGIKR